MSKSIELFGPQPDYVRESTRFAARGSVTIMRDDIKRSPGDLINVSANGAAFRAFEIFPIGEGYRIEIENFGVFDCRIVRRFGGTNYGCEFILDADAKKRLHKRLDELNAMRPLGR
ncbi:MAG: PilZ domain-containing protein [Parvularculaceae bacterium]|nr:PilZ domain-containing protein [Parvularculaceae bacterium]